MNQYISICELCSEAHSCVDYHHENHTCIRETRELCAEPNCKTTEAQCDGVDIVGFCCLHHNRYLEKHGFKDVCYARCRFCRIREFNEKHQTKLTEYLALSKQLVK
jgi:hypothetical protein